jgi:hypothetical protein
MNRPKSARLSAQQAPLPSAPPRHAAASENASEGIGAGRPQAGKALRSIPVFPSDSAHWRELFVHRFAKKEKQVLNTILLYRATFCFFML